MPNTLGNKKISCKIRFLVLLLPGKHISNKVLPNDFQVKHEKNITVHDYRYLHYAVGYDCRWWGSHVKSDAELEKIIKDEHIPVYTLMKNNTVVGLLEIDTSLPPRASINFIGLNSKYRTQEIGEFWIDWAIRKCEGLGAKYVSLITSADDAGDSLSTYLKNKFDVVFQSDETWPVPEKIKKILPQKYQN